MSYGRNFGMRGFENAVRMGRFKVAADFDESADGDLYLGTAVVGDANGNLVRPAANAAPNGLSGLLVYEHIQYQGVDTALTTSNDPPFNKAPKGRYAQVLRGPGTKVWFKNTTTKTLYDGREQTGVTMFAGGGATPTVAVGDYLRPAANGTWQEGGDAQTAWMQVEQISEDGNLIECRILF